MTKKYCRKAVNKAFFKKRSKIKCRRPENQEIFREILSITQILSKYGLSADKIYFDGAGEVTLYFGDVRARLGSEDNIEEKVARLQQLLPDAEGKKGVFRLENYSGSGENVTFELDD